MFKMKQVIITGADGFIGSYTVDYFLLKGVRVLALDVYDKPRKTRDNPLLTYRKCNVENTHELEEVIADQTYDAFIHFAWAGTSGILREDYNLQIKNALTTVECLKIANKNGCPRFIVAGSIMEREVEAVIHMQGSNPSMGYIYGMGKHIAHCLCKSIASALDIELIWGIITNAYGEGEESPRFINTTIRKIINGEQLTFTEATQNYDFIHVEDVARAFYLISKNGKPFCEYLIGSSKARPLREYIIEMEKELAPSIKPIFGEVPFEGVNLPLSAFDTSEIENDCQFHASIPFDKGVRRLFCWLNDSE